MKNNYYWSDDWSEEFYMELAKAGFICTTYDTINGLVLLPELQYSYAILDFKNIHISKKVKNMINKNLYELCINTRFDNVVEEFCKQHKDNWLKENYVELLKKLYQNYDEKNNFKIISVELISKKTNELIAGEVGYIIGNTYTSLSGFSSRKKEFSNTGNLQLVLLSKYLEKNSFEFWNLGHPHMEYKKRLGCKVYERVDFLNRWNKATQ